jgi:hypothetical protein
MLLSEADFEKACSVEFYPLSEGRLHLTYPDGEERIFNVWDYLKRHGRTVGMWAAVFDQEFFNTVQNVSGMPVWGPEECMTMAPETLLLYSDPILSSKSSYISLSMSKITADNAIPGVQLYINEDDHNPPHVLARSHNEKEANFYFDGSVMNGNLDKSAMRLTSKFIKSHKEDIERAGAQIEAGGRVDPLIK